MEKTKFAIGVDEVLRTVAIWLLSAVILRYFIKEIIVIVVLATVVTALITFLLHRYYAKKNLSLGKIRQMDDAMRELIVCDREALLSKLANSVGGNIDGEAIITSNVVIYPYFFGKLPIETLNQKYNAAKKKGKKLLILCNDVSQEVEKNASLFCDIPVKILRKRESYAFLDKYQALPETVKRPKKRTTFFKTALKKSKIKGYLACAILLLLTAAFSPYAILCVIAASINITLSILSYAKGD